MYSICNKLAHVSTSLLSYRPVRWVKVKNTRHRSPSPPGSSTARRQCTGQSKLPHMWGTWWLKCACKRHPVCLLVAQINIKCFVMFRRKLIVVMVATWCKLLLLSCLWQAFDAEIHLHRDSDAEKNGCSHAAKLNIPQALATALRAVQVASQQMLACKHS